MSFTSLAIFSPAGLILVLKFLHVGLGILWVGSSLVPPFDFSSAGKFKFTVWTATLTAITGLLHVVGNYSLSFYSSWGLSMLLGSALGLVMWLHLLVFIGPARKSGKTARAEVFSFVNFALALPMLFFMEMASHLGLDFDAQSEKLQVILALSVPVILFEVYCVVGKGPQIINLRRALGCGLFLLCVLYLALELLTKQG